MAFVDYQLVKVRRRTELYSNNVNLDMEFVPHEKLPAGDGGWMRLPNKGEIFVTRQVDAKQLDMMEPLLEPGTIFQMDPENAPTKARPHNLISTSKAVLIDDGEFLRVVRILKQQPIGAKQKSKQREKYSNFQTVDGMREWLAKGMPRYKDDRVEPEPEKPGLASVDEAIDWAVEKTKAAASPFSGVVPTSSQIEHPIRDIGTPRLQPKLYKNIEKHVMSLKYRPITPELLARIKHDVKAMVIQYFTLSSQGFSYDSIEFEKCFGFSDISRLDIVVKYDGATGIDITWGEIIL